MSDCDPRENADHWGAAADHWARAAEKDEVGAAADAARWMLAAADLQPGERVLEVAGGAGRVGLQAASEVGAEGSVLCSDYSEQMVKVSRERFERLRRSNIETRQLDAHELDLPDGTFDAVLCRFGYMLMPHPLQALRESGRVLRPGGRLVLAVWGEAGDNPWLSIVLDAVRSQLDAPAPEPGTPGPFALGDPAQVRDLLGRAGLVDVEVEELATEQRYDSLVAWWEKILSVGGPLQAIMEPLPEVERTAIRDAVLSRGRQFASADGPAAFPATLVGATAKAQ